MRPFYDKYYTDYCASFGPKIKLLFELLSGYSYELARELKQIDEDTIEFSGDAYSILKIYDKIMGCKDLRVECDKDRSWIESQQKFVLDPIDRFIREQGCNMTKDISKVTVRFHRIK